MPTAARAFRALADPTRREILQALRKGELAAGAIVELFPMTGPSVSRHLSILKAADLIAERREGNRIFYRLEPQPLAQCLGDFLSAVCPTQRALRKKGKP